MMVNTTSTLKRGLLALALLFVAALVALAVYRFSQRFFLSYNVTNLQGLAILSSPTPMLNAEGTPLPTVPVPGPSGPTPQPWDGASRVTVLLMGLDYGDWSKDREGPSRTDTMILFTVDPVAKTGGVLNIPRDLWVNIPGFEYGRINTAYYLGEAYQVPGGGAAQAILTVEELLGVPINYYAQVDFYAFEKFIDIIGGITVNVPEEIKVDPIGKGNTVILQPGEQTLDGPVALAYARARYTEGGDFDRAQRQQQVIKAIRARVLTPSLFPTLLSRAPEIYKELAGGIHTNMTLEQAIQFAWLAQEIPEENIRMGAIAPPDQVILTKSPDGSQDVLKPIPDKIRQLRDNIFAADISPLSRGVNLADLMKSEGARIAVLNGTLTEGLAARTQAYLLSQGAASVTTGNAGEILTVSKIIDYSGKPYTRRYLVELMKIPENQIFYQDNPSGEVDIVVFLGNDWSNNNPMP